MGEAIITLDGLSKFYTSAQNVVVGLNHVSLSFSRGEFVAITGESGSGKSTLAHVIGGILPYESGELLLEGKPTSHYDGKDWETYRRDRISFISQNYGILMNSTVLENVTSALCLTGTEQAEAALEAKKILERVDLWQLRSRRAAKLSSGQKQRLSIARALAKPAAILLADEPTGNLDPENSAKVIELLADVTKERLVILITHDFAEAENYATRRISLQDGHVVMDAQLRPAAAVEPMPKKTRSNRKPLSFYISRLQLGGRPVWGSLVMAFFALTAFAVFAFLGTFIVALDDTPTRVYDNEAFLNGDKNRVVVQRLDGEGFTQEDYDRLLTTQYVVSLEPYGYVTDIGVHYVEDYDYRYSYEIVNVGSSIDPVYVQVKHVRLLDNGCYAQTVPMLAGDREFLKAGRLPQNMFEVVAVGPESQIGDTFRLYIQNRQTWNRSAYIYLDVTVVGVSDYGSGIYLHEDLSRALTHNMAIGGKNLLLPANELEGMDCIVAESVLEGKDKIPPMRVVDYRGEEASLIIRGTHDMAYSRTILVSRELFNQLTLPGPGSQVSLKIQDYSYTDRVLQQIRDMGYVAVSPYQMGSTTQVESLAQEREQTLMICLGALLMVVALQIIVLRTLFGSQLENYRLLANIGLSCRTAKQSVWWQVLLFTLWGQIVGFALLLLCNHWGVERIVNIVKYMPPALMAVLSAVHLAAAMLAAVWICASVQRKIYPMSRHRTDLALDEGEEGSL